MKKIAIILAVLIVVLAGVIYITDPYRGCEKTSIGGNKAYNCKDKFIVTN